MKAAELVVGRLRCNSPSIILGTCIPGLQPRLPCVLAGDREGPGGLATGDNRSFVVVGRHPRLNIAA